jgi:hypothetical protein
MMTTDECIANGQECSHEARQNGLFKRERDVLYAMSRTWDTLGRQTALLEELRASQAFTRS